MGLTNLSIARRRLAATAALAGAACTVAYAGATSTFGGPLLLVAVLLAGASAGIGRRSVLAQVLARGAALTVLGPCVAAAVALSVRGRLPDAGVLGLTATMAVALALSRPFLHTDAARAEFAPVAYRRWFLAGAVTSVAMSLAAFVQALAATLWTSTAHGLAVGVLGVMLLASGIGVVKMRAWGVLLGIVTATVSLGAAALGLGDPSALGVAAIPGLLGAAPLALSRLRLGAPPRYRVDPPLTAPTAPLGRARVTPTSEIPAAEDQEDDEELARATVCARPRPAV